MHLLVGLIMIGVGVVIMWKSEALLSNFGRIQFFEMHLGAEGGSRLGYKLVGLAVIFFGILVFANLFTGFLAWILSPLIRYSQNLNNI